jgi:hypothetical protein
VVAVLRLVGSGGVVVVLRLAGSGSVIVDREEPALVAEEVAVVLWGILRQLPPERSNPSGHRWASSFRRFSTASRVEVVDCWVVVCMTSLRDWLDNAAVERAPVPPPVQKPPLKTIPGVPFAVVGQKIWASALDADPITNSGRIAPLAAAILR